MSVTYALWSSLILLCGCTSPLYVILTNSMKSNYNRGDLVILFNRTVLNTGDVVMFMEHSRYEYVGRVIAVQHTKEGEERFLTKGDGNPIDDRFLYEE